MLHRLLLMATLLFGRLASSAPAPAPAAAASAWPLGSIHSRAALTTAAEIIAYIMLNSTSCDGAAYPDECRTNVEAAPYFISAFQDYDVYSQGEMAGILALVGYESGDLKYKHNVVPGVAGQGTSNMQSPINNALYAASISALASGLAAANSDPTAVLALVTPDTYNFGSGPWFLTTQCSDDVLTQLATGSDDGFTMYMDCVQVEASDTERQEYWSRAKTAFGL